MKPIFLLLFFIGNITTSFTDPGKRFMGEWIIVKTSCTEAVGDNLYQEKTSGFLETTRITFTIDKMATVTSFDGKTLATFPFELSGNGKNITLHYEGNDGTLKRFNGIFKMGFSRKKGKTYAQLYDSNDCYILLER